MDFGTSSAKTGLFQGNKLIEVGRGLSLQDVTSLVRKHQPAHIIISTVSVSRTDIAMALGERIPILFLDSTISLPLSLAYGSPDTLGADRIAAAVGASQLYPRRNCLVIDAGSCTTYEFIDENNIYQGGGISPGIDLKLRALHNYTANLPLLERVTETKLVGDTTNNAMLSGVINGTIAEIREIIRMYQNKFPDLQLVICGGDASYFATKLNIEVFVAPELVLTGLKNILDYNVQKP